MNECPEILGSEIRGAGFFPVENSFQAPSTGLFVLNLQPEAEVYIDVQRNSLPQFGGWANESCTWNVLIFEFPECLACDRQIESALFFHQDGFGSSSKLLFHRILGRQSMQREFKRTDNFFSLVVDPADRLFEQLAVQATPFSALVDSRGLVRGHYPGYVEYNSPGFEVLSWRLSGKKESVNGWVILLALGLAAIGLVGFLGYNLARWRRRVL